MPRAEPARTPPSNSRKRRLPSQDEFPWDRPAPRSDAPEHPANASKKRRMVRGKGSEEGGAYMRLAAQDRARAGPMTDPVQSSARPAKPAVVKRVPSRAKRVPTSENEPPALPPRTARSAALPSAPVATLASPFQYRTHTPSWSSMTSPHTLSPLGSSIESVAGNRGRARAASLRAQPYPGASRPEKPVRRPTEPAVSLMGTLLSTPLATSTPKPANSPLPLAQDEMDLDTLNLPDDNEGSSESDVPAAKTTKTGKHPVSDREGRTSPENAKPKGKDGDDLNDMFSGLGLNEEKGFSTLPTRRVEKDRKVVNRFTSNAKQGMRAEGKKCTAENKLKSAAVGSIQSAQAIKSKLKKENVDANKLKTPKRPVIQPLQPKRRTTATIPTVVMKSTGGKAASPVSKAFVQKKRTDVWMKINDKALEPGEDSSDDEIAAW
ncbi:hypothetical protein CALCODRAFT_516101 [Calocera cornea HHB12733]|uniref:Uncharacterized protein n=1 Tax=Calocera cornea HHB12733 TaxID=1353952 RepID=A0A165HN29_9BASI|nr:hypothetical protein CALCODRAFT_516101 [Calocera cornea HHB12733]